MSDSSVKSIHDLELNDTQVVLCRVDFNVPMNGTEIRDDYRSERPYRP